MKEILQHLLLPKNPEQSANYHLYYRGTHCVIDDSTILIPQYVHIEFNTYFNGFSYKKWCKYTNLKSCELHIRVSGSMNLLIYGYSLSSYTPERNLLYETKIDSEEKTEVIIRIPENKDQMVGLEIDTYSPSILYGGEYIAEFPDERSVNLCIATTTMKKEKYIKANIKLLKETLFDGDNDIKDHLFIHVVDNGRTLKKSDFPSHPHIWLHPNKNVGGSGGFARGMIESMHQEIPATHVLLMDDDVKIDSESIYKTYVLLKHLKDDYKESFISGAMLYMEDINIQKEDIGVVNDDGYFVPLKKREYNHKYLWDNLKNEQDYTLAKRSYAAWWYCCIPMDVIKKEGLPIPVFVRGDDVEYGLRCKPKEIITMNGICVWHMGFAGKFNAAMDFYQVDRNMLILKAMGLLDGVDIVKKMQNEIDRAIFRFDYDTADLIVRAMEDYLKGPEFIEQDLGEKILLENNKKVHKMIPLKELGDPDVGEPDSDTKSSLPFLLLAKCKATKNGTRFYLGKYDEKPGIVIYKDEYQPARVAFKKKLYAINSVNRTGYVLERDNKRGKEIKKEFKKKLKRYDHSTELTERYKKEKQHMITEEFWRKYLEIDAVESD